MIRERARNRCKLWLRLLEVDIFLRGLSVSYTAAANTAANAAARGMYLVASTARCGAQVLCRDSLSSVICVCSASVCISSEQELLYREREGTKCAQAGTYSGGGVGFSVGRALWRLLLLF